MVLLPLKDAIRAQVWGCQRRLDASTLNEDVCGGPEVLREMDGWTPVGGRARRLYSGDFQSQMLERPLSLMLLFFLGRSGGADEFARDGEALAEY